VYNNSRAIAVQPREYKNKLMIRFDQVSKIYKGDFSALENINLEIKNGEFV